MFLNLSSHPPANIFISLGSRQLAMSPDSGKGCPQIFTHTGAHLPLSVRTQSSGSKESKAHLPCEGQEHVEKAEAHGAAQPHRELSAVG